MNTNKKKLMTAKERAPLSRPAKIAVLIFTNLIILCGLVYGFELYLRATDPFLALPFDTSYYERYQRYYDALDFPQKHLVGEEEYSWGHLAITNKFQFREREFDRPKPAAVCRVVVLGDSFTWGTGLALEERYTNLVEQALKDTFPDRTFEVFSLAYGGAATVGQRDLLRNYGALLLPDLVVVGFVSNDTQPKRQSYRLEKEQFDEKYGLWLDEKAQQLVEVGLVQTARALREAVDNVMVTAGAIPSWEVGLQRTYEPDSAEWQAFTAALVEIKAMSDEMGLPPPVFAVLNQDVYWEHPTEVSNLDAALPIYVRWYHQAEQAAAEAGFRTYNHERELLEQIERPQIPLNALDNHPSAGVNQIYANKLFEVIAGDVSTGRLCPPDRVWGAVAAADQPLAERRLMSVKFGDEIRFWGYLADNPQVVGGDVLRLTFGWQALAPIEANYVIFVDLIDDEGRVWASEATIPCQGDCQTLFWPPGVVGLPGAEVVYWPEDEELNPLPIGEIPYDGQFRDAHELPLDSSIPPGVYQVVMGIVWPTTGERLAAFDEIAQVQLPDRQVLLGTIEIE